MNCAGPRTLRHAVAGTILLSAGPCLAQATQSPPSKGAAAQAAAEGDDNTIVVNGPYQTQRGAVQTDIPPEQQLSPADIRAYGVNSVTELLTELAPETRSDRGRGGGGPVTLLNGRRISGFAEIRDIPTEAIERVDILPEEVALGFGYSADQRVVNIVLRRRFRSITGDVEGTTGTEGGANAGQLESGLLRIRQGTRLNLNVQANTSEEITQADRNLTSRDGTPAAGSTPSTTADTVDDSRYRTVRPKTNTLALNSVYATTILGNVGATVNATLDVNDSDSLNGLPADLNPLKQSIDSVTGHLGVTLNKDVGKWRNSLTVAYDHVDSRTRTERSLIATDDGDVFTDRAKSKSDVGNIQFVAAGPLIALPAGPLTGSFTVGDTASGFDATSTRMGIDQSADLSRNDLTGRLSFDLPLTSKRNDVLSAIGNLSVNVNFAGDHISDFGTLGSYGYGANWTPRKGISLIASFTMDRSAPTVQQLGNPTVLTPDVRTFDYIRGTTVDISQLGGGNPDLKADRRRVMKLGATIKPLDAVDLTFTANYIHSRTNNEIATFPEPTAAIEAAFPGRFTRDADGDLTEIDTRPINFAQEERSELRWGFTFSKPLKSDSAKLMAALRQTPRFKEMQAQREKEQAARAALQAQNGAQPGTPGQPGDPQGAPREGGGGGDRGPGSGGFRGPGGGGFGPGGFGGGRGGGQNSGRLQFAFYHTWHFKDQVLIRDGLPVLDLLHGDTIGSTGGTAQHELEVQMGYSNNGIGARLSGNWQSATNVDAGPSSLSGNLHFAPLTTANFRLFLNLGQQASLVKYWWAQGTRITLSVNNLLNTHERVTDATGATPLRYQAGYLDPTGRTIKLGIRKLFF